MKKASSAARAFTLVELLVVIAIIAILSGIILTDLTSSKAKARDGQRISDLGQIQVALELFFDRCHQYPTEISDLGSLGDCQTDGSITLGSYISVIPQSPAGGSVAAGPYDYYVNSDQTDYILHATLESPNGAQQNSLPDSVVNPLHGTITTYSGSSWSSVTLPTCYDSTNSSSVDYCVGPK
jgi:prepilin-type N-terminal cleavage/methylation domain-containing protein